MSIKLLRITRILSLLTVTMMLTACSTSSVVYQPRRWLHFEARDTSFWTCMCRDFAINYDLKNPNIQKQIKWYQQHPRHLHKVLKDSEPFIHYVYQQTRNRKLPAELALIPLIESRYDPAIHAKSGAAGLWQMMPGTASKFGLQINKTYDGRRDVIASTKAALDYLTYLHGYFNQDWLFALAAYDAGEGRVKSVAWKNHKHNFWNLSLSKETQVYVPRLLAIAAIIKNPQNYHIALPKVKKELSFQEIVVNKDRSVKMSEVAKQNGIALQELRHYNPGFRGNTQLLPGSYRLLIPASSTTAKSYTLDTQLTKRPATSELKNHTPAKPSKIILKSKSLSSHVSGKKDKHSQKYTIHPGDNLAKIAKKFHVTPTKLKSWNHIKNEKHLKIGQKIITTGS
jgi:LysM repeat protein